MQNNAKPQISINPLFTIKTMTIYIIQQQLKISSLMQKSAHLPKKTQNKKKGASKNSLIS